MSICEKIIRLAYGALFIVTPLLVCPWTHELFEFPKMLFVYALTIIIFSAFLVKIINTKYQIRNTILGNPVFVPIFVYFATYCISAVFSIHPYTSVFGYYGRFHGGLLSLIAYIALFYIFILEFSKAVILRKASSADEESPATSGNLIMRFFSRLFDKSKRLPQSDAQYKSLLTFCYLLLCTGFLVSLYGILQHFGIDNHFWVQDSSARVFSTLGQPNWLAAWLVMLLPLSWVFYLSSKKAWLTAVGWWLSAGFFASFWFTYSLSGLLGVAAALVVFVALIPKKLFFKNKVKSFLLIAGYLLVVTAFPGLITRRVQELKKQVNVTPQVYAAQSSRGSGDTLEIRLIVWRGALEVWQSSFKNMLIGTGPETFAYAFLPHRPRELNQTSEWDFLYNKAHNEYIDILLEHGLLGFVAYVGLIGAFIGQFLSINYKFQIKSTKNTKYKIPNTRYFSVALFSGWLGFLVTNLFGFTVVPTALLFWLYPAIALGLRKCDRLS